MPLLGMDARRAICGQDLHEEYNVAVPAYTRGSVGQVNLGKRRRDSRGEQTVPQPAREQLRAQPALRTPEPVARPAAEPEPQSVKRLPPMQVPRLESTVLRGQKTPLNLPQGHTRLLVGIGWNVKDERCDVDASAFLLGTDGRVPDDDWFVFYGQPESPDGAVTLREDGLRDRQQLTLDIARLDQRVRRLVLVLTINEALKNSLHFGMLKDVWIRVMDGDTGRELVSYQPEELYAGVTSMTLGELYPHNGQWRFNPVGNGVRQDLAGQCAIYGVRIS